MHKPAIIIILAAIMTTVLSCNTIRVNLDISGLRDISSSILAEYTKSGPAELEKYMAGPDIYARVSVMNVTVSVQPLDRWDVGDIQGRKIKSERLSFPSLIKKTGGEQDAAVFYYYYSGQEPSAKAVIWVPGFGVSDLGFLFIRKFFREALKRGYDVLFYNIPYHLERVETGHKPGEGLISAGAKRNIEMTVNVISEIRTAYAFLKSKGVKSIGGWGGSIGASYLLLDSSAEAYDHLCVMIPLVDWNIVMNNPEMKSLYQKNIESGFTPGLLRKAYSLISPFNYATLTQSLRIQVLYARYDQLTPAGKIMEFADKYGINNIHGYEESHSTILLNSKMYDDYGVFLDSLR